MYTAVLLLTFNAYLLSFPKVILSGGTSHTPKIAQLIQSLFSGNTSTASSTTTAMNILSRSTSATALNPSELSVRGAAIQASLIEEFDKEDIEQSSHPMVTVTPHLTRAVGVMVLAAKDQTADREGVIFHPLLEAETAVPARRAALFPAPKDGGHVLVRLCEAVREIRISRAEPKASSSAAAKINGNKSESDSDEDNNSSDDEMEEPQEIRERTWKVSNVLAEVAVRDVGKATAGKKRSKIEVMANVASDLSVQFTAREIVSGDDSNTTTKGGVRGGIDKPGE